LYLPRFIARHANTLAHYPMPCKHKMTHNVFTHLNTNSTRYAIRGQLAISLHIGKRLGPYRETVNAAQPGPPERGNGKPGETRPAGNGDQTQTKRNSIHFYPDKCFFSSRNASTHHDMLISTPPPFPRSPFPGKRGPPFPLSPYRFPVSRLFVRFSNRLGIYCIDCASKSLRVQAGGRGCVRASAFFCIIITPPTTFFAISSPSVMCLEALFIF
jgi:hypothetical protein